MTSPSAPAAVPSEADVAELLVSAHASLATPQNTARAILALFAPILAEKERDSLRRETRALAQAQDWRNVAEKAEARALAAIAAERERCAKVAEAQDKLPCRSLLEGQRAEDYDCGQIDAATSIAAAIRAQGE